MAGIGFELYKILQKGTIASVLKAFLLGIIIVAGPWLLSILSLYLIQKYAIEAIREFPALFTVSIVYVYAFSLSLFGGIHYIFSRYIADLIYEEKNEEIPATLFSGIMLVSVLAIVIAASFIYWNPVTFITFPFMYKIFFVALYWIINVLWLLLIYVSLLKAFYTIFFLYFLGVLISVYSVTWLGDIYGVGGAMAGYAAGHLFIVLGLLAVAQKTYPVSFRYFNLKFLTYIQKFRYLFLTGLLFNFAIWIDKFFLWFSRGERLQDTYFFYYAAYDIPVFISYLTMIPGLVYFLIVGETVFHREYFDFIKSILDDRFVEIQRKKERMNRALRFGLSGLVFFQIVFTMSIIINERDVLQFLGFPGLDTAIVTILLVAVFFHLMALILQIYLLYFQLERVTFYGSCLLFGLNFFFSLAMYLGWSVIPGTGYMLASAISSLYMGFILLKTAPRIDYIVFSKMQ